MLAALAAAGVLLGSYFRVLDLYELQTYDWRCQIRGPRPVSDKIVLIDIWDDTLKTLGAWPFDRGYHGELVRILSAHGVKAVGFDTLFVEPRDGDETFAREAARAGNVYFVYAFLDPRASEGRFFSNELIAPLLEEYQKAAAGSGHVNAKADRDGKRRRTYPVIRHRGQDHYQLSFRMAMDVFGVKAEDVIFRPRREIQFSPSLKVPLDDESYFLVNYAGRWEKTFRHYSYYDILASDLELASGRKPRVDLEDLKGAVCFVGLTSLGSHDTNPIPIQSVYPMVGMYANVLNGILEKDFIRRLDRFSNLALLALFGLWIVRMSRRFRPIVALTGLASVIAVYTLGALAVFCWWGLWVDLFYPLTVFVVIYAVSTLSRVILEVKKREVIEGELKIASQIQKSFLPQALPDHKGLELAVYMKPAKAVGGDLYAFTPLGEGSVGVMAGDVSGKGAPAALFMAKVVSEFKFFARDENDPAAVLRTLNDSVASESTGGLFVTLTYVIFDVKGRRLVMSNAGHLPMVLVDPQGRSVLLSGGEGMPVGVLEGADFSNAERPLAEGECLVLYSDGVTEARNRKTQEYGIERLSRVILEGRHRRAGDILAQAVADLNRFMGKADQHDDITLIVVKFTGVKSG